MPTTKDSPPEWHKRVRAQGLIPQPHGGALMPGGGWRPGAGRPKSRLKMVLREAKRDPARQLKLVSKLVRDESLAIGERIRAATYIFKLALKLEEKAEQRPTFRVVTRTPQEAIELLHRQER